MDDRYGTPEGFRLYHTARGRIVNDLSDEEINASLLVASERNDNRYRSMLSGTKVGMRAQIRDWPRNSVVDVNGYVVPNTSVPVEVENAAYEAALIDARDPGALVKNYTPNKYESVSLEGALSVKFANINDASDVQNQYPAIDAIIAPVLCSRSGGSALSGTAVRV